MWLYLAALLGLYFLRRWYKERQTVENLTEKYVLITGCSSGFGNHLARHLDARGVRVLATCTTQKGAEQLEKVTSKRLKTTVLDVTSTESVAAATEWVKEQAGSKVYQLPHETITGDFVKSLTEIKMYYVHYVLIHQTRYWFGELHQKIQKGENLKGYLRFSLYIVSENANCGIFALKCKGSLKCGMG
ncbi:17-beta-hydroxysteroid dehydrogenase type 6-like [Lacerta agilis]|uniref:17-beta-hydroxysteroid dehydrogenase type 6-like n=1 Tax=Lacerta agilis TaxID=80427 RepID=UPI00141953C0|nr:17-beta-hydroxysteroid dehydrogenase type 6-like [Lacerta agilis]